MSWYNFELTALNINFEGLIIIVYQVPVIAIQNRARFV